MRNLLLTACDWIEAIAVNLVGIAIALGILTAISMLFSAIR